VKPVIYINDCKVSNYLYSDKWIYTHTQSNTKYPAIQTPTNLTWRRIFKQKPRRWKTGTFTALLDCINSALCWCQLLQWFSILNTVQCAEQYDVRPTVVIQSPGKFGPKQDNQTQLLWKKLLSSRPGQEDQEFGIIAWVWNLQEALYRVSNICLANIYTLSPEITGFYWWLLPLPPPTMFFSFPVKCLFKSHLIFSSKLVEKEALGFCAQKNFANPS